MAHGHHHGDHAPGATHEAVALDPENEIDARSATIWVVGGAIVTFLSLWIMVPIFMRVLDEERMQKVAQWNTLPAAQLLFELATVEPNVFAAEAPAGLAAGRLLRRIGQSHMRGALAPRQSGWISQLIFNRNN